MPGRIAETEHALNLRERELWYSGGSHTQERLALIGARRALEALGISTRVLTGFLRPLRLRCNRLPFP